MEDATHIGESSPEPSEPQATPQTEASAQEAPHLSPLARHLISALHEKRHHSDDRRLTVNPLVSKVAVWYEKLRKAMEYREEEVMLRATIERILRRRLTLGGNAKTTAEPLVRELLWARYLPENETTEETVAQVEHSIDLFLRLRFAVLKDHKIPESKLNEWIYSLMSSDIEHILNPMKEKELIGNFFYQIIKDQVTITDANEETTSAQVYIAVRKAFARDDIAFLRYHLFRLYFGTLTEASLPEITERFYAGYTEIQKELSYPKKEKIYAYVKKRSAAFLILEDVIKANKDSISQLVHDRAALKHAVSLACEARYRSIAAKVRTAIVRSVIFILFTKVLFAFAVEGTYERIFYGEILWTSILLNTTIPPFLMIIVSLFIRTPGEDNTERIFEYIQKLLYEENPKLGNRLQVKTNEGKGNAMTVAFSILWFLAFLITFGGISLVLSHLRFHLISQFIFMFFVAIVSFLSYRISLTAHIYRLGDKQGWFTPIADFLFMPVIRVGRGLTQSISQVNIVLFLFDFLIEAPFKLLFSFFEEWFKFLNAKREEME